MRVWVVDDEDAILEIMARALAIRGHQVEVFDSADAIRARLREKNAESPRVMLIDQRLGPGSGVEVARMVQVVWPDTAVVMMSGDPGSLSDLPRGFTGLAKPFRLDRLREAVETKATS